jgi:hypothetical protein
MRETENRDARRREEEPAGARETDPSREESSFGNRIAAREEVRRSVEETNVVVERRRFQGNRTASLRPPFDRTVSLSQ